jgi:uncharacterized membrane protein YqaE (UPF0057 family)
VYYFATKGATPEEISNWEIKLFMPPLGVVPEEGPWTAEAEIAGFRGLAHALNINTQQGTYAEGQTAG